jgi:NAD+ kinase
MQSAFSTVGFYFRPDNTKAADWKKKLTAWLRTHAPSVKVVTERPELLIILGGDGTIIEAVRKHADYDPVFLGMNLGTVGFLASVRESKQFLSALKAVLTGKFTPEKRLLLKIVVKRKGKTILETATLNEAAILNPMGMVGIDISVDGAIIQHVSGSGALVATPTGSTGYNLSAHGPIVDPRLACMIITEILDHNLPTPSIVVPADQTVTLTVTDFRKRGTILVQGGQPAADVVLAAGGWVELALEPKDRVIVSRAPASVRIAQIYPHYFYKSLHEKFSLT